MPILLHTDKFLAYDYKVTFLSHVGDLPLLDSCCDETTAVLGSDSKPREVMLFSKHTSDARIVVEETRKGPGEQLNGFFMV